MYISDKLISFLNDSTKLSNSTIIISDFNNILFAANDSKNKVNYLNCCISDELKNIFKFFSDDLSSVDYINFCMDKVIPIFLNDDISQYKSQIFLPIVHEHCVDGLLIFISIDRYYIKSNLEFAKTTRNFVEKLTTF